MKALPTLGGINGAASWINNRGEIVGVAENAKLDKTCPANGPQKFQFKPVMWLDGKIQELPTFGSDQNGYASANNNNGQAAGASGDCATLQPNGNYLLGRHALLWEKGLATDLGNLGGTAGHFAFAINNQTQVAGVSDLAGDTSFHAFLWSQKTGMQDLGTLPGDFASAAIGINDAGTVVGLSLDPSFNLRAFVWQDGVMSDLNSLIPAGSRLTIIHACGLNSRGEITGLAVTSTGEVHGYLASPAGTTALVGPKNTTVITRQITLDGTASFSADGKPLTYEWSIPQGSPQAAILHGNTATPEVQFASGRNVYIFQLTVTDSAGTSATDLVTVNFQGN